MSLGGAQKQSGYTFAFTSVTITTAVTGVIIGGPITGLAGMKMIALQGVFTYGSGGTTAKLWLQTSLDFGVTWFDVMSQAFLLATLTKVGAVSAVNAGFTPATPTDAALADNTANQGILGDRFRVKLTTTGTYAGGTTIKVSGNVKG